MSYRVARKTACGQGHTHASKAEAKRCNELHLLERAGKIRLLTVEPTYHFYINGSTLMMSNGHKGRYRPDFTYIEGDRMVAEDVKPKNGLVEPDWPLRAALFRHCYPDIELRVIK